MRKNLMSNLALTVAFILILGSTVNGQITPTPVWMSFYDDASTYNGQPLQIGTVVQAFDPDGVLCGEYIVDKEGLYGFMTVYGDDLTTDVVDEGAEVGDEISFEINGIPATATGNITFTDQVTSQVSLAASPTLISLTMVNPPSDMLGSFNQIVTFTMDVRNDGDGLDFYGVSAVSTQPGYTTLPQTDTVYAAPGQTVTLSFRIQTPIWPGDDTVNVINYEVHSINDPSVFVDGSVTLYFTITDVGDDNHGGLPSSFTLYQNYPNPFNPTTTIAYSLPKASRVELQVINVLGQLVESHDLGANSPGDHEVEYDASYLSSGVYFYRIVTEYSSQTRKMVLMK